MRRTTIRRTAGFGLRALICFVRRARRAGTVGGRGPAGQQSQRVLGRGFGFGAVGEQALAWVAGQGEELEWQVQMADHRVMDELYAAGVDSDVVGRPATAEVFAAGGQLPDQV